MEARFACGSVVPDLSFSRNVGSKSQHFVKKNGIFRPAGGAMFFRVRNRVRCVIEKHVVLLRNMWRGGPHNPT
jgi:hypothetical protein